MKGRDKIAKGTWSRKRRKRFYLAVLPRIRRVARASGYAIGVHGSMSRDLDLIAAPWSHRCVQPLTLAMRIQQLISGAFRYSKKSMWDHNRTVKPHGRIAFVIMTKHFGSGMYVDLSVMPKGMKEEW